MAGDGSGGGTVTGGNTTGAPHVKSQSPPPPLALAHGKKTPEQAPPESPATTKWNTKNLGLRLGADLLSAASAAVLVAPIITMVDRSIMENASGRAPLAASLRTSLRTLLLRPHRFLLSKPFALVSLLYGGTYLTANALDTAAATLTSRPAGLVTSGTPKFLASSAANVGLCIYKDQAFVRMFGPGPAATGVGGAAARAVPLASYALFTARDCMTIFASFNVPPVLGPWLQQSRVLSGGGVGEVVGKYVSGLTAAQFLAPAAVQVVSTPLHLLGLDVYNRPDGGGGGGSGGPGAWDRWAAVRKNWAISAAARMCRIIPAFGVGGVVNFKVRRDLMARLS